MKICVQFPNGSSGNLEPRIIGKGFFSEAEMHELKDDVAIAAITFEKKYLPIMRFFA